jgi:hypothetical protein
MGQGSFDSAFLPLRGRNASLRMTGFREEVTQLERENEIGF